MSSRTPGVRAIALAMALALPLPSALARAAPTHQDGKPVKCGSPGDLPPASLLLLGEMHGSVEAPRVAGDIACARAVEGPAALGLEIPAGEQPAIDRYLDSDGGRDAKAALLASRFWQHGEDGRSSVAMAELIERVRQLRQQGLPLSLFAFDIQSSGSENRDAVLADAIRAHRAAHPDTAIVVLVGNVHASLAPMDIEGQRIVTTGSRLADLRAVSILLTYHRGTIWACMPDCGIHAVSGRHGEGRPAGLAEDVQVRGYSRVYVLPSITASPPAAKVAP